MWKIPQQMAGWWKSLILGATLLLFCQRRLQNPRSIDFGHHIFGVKILGIVGSFMASRNFLWKGLGALGISCRNTAVQFSSQRSSTFCQILNYYFTSHCMEFLSRTGNGICQRRSCHFLGWKLEWFLVGTDALWILSCGAGMKLIWVM